MKLKTGKISRRKILAIMLTAAMLFSLLPAGLTAAENGNVTLIQSGDYTISADGIYQLANGYSGMITIDKSAYGVRIIGSKDGKVHTNTCIKVAERPLPLQLMIEDLKITAPEGMPAIDLGNASGVNYYEKWPFNLNNAEKPAPYSQTGLLRFGGDCSVTGGDGRAGVFVGDGFWLTIDKLPDQTEAQARLTAVGGSQGAGIGGDRGFSGGSVSINGGTIIATGGDTAAGLGSLAGAITINGGTITATGGRSAPGLGNGFNTISRIREKYQQSTEETLMSRFSLVIPGETIIINGGKVTAVGNGEAGIYALGGMKLTPDIYNDNIRKYMLGRLTVNGGSVTASGNGEFSPVLGISGRQVEINGGLVSAFSNNGPGINGVETTINGGTVVASGGSSPNEFLDFVNDGLGMFKDTMNSPEETENSQEAALAFEKLEDMFKSMADVLISALFSSGGGGAGIGLFSGDSLTINDGIIIARGGPSSAGIGGSVIGGLAGMFAMNKDFTPGHITIKGGLISATGGSGAAGIGGGYKQRAEGITISGNPTVIATRGSDGAQDIGFGEGQDFSGSSLRNPFGKALSYIRLEVKDKTTGQPLPDKKVTVGGAAYFTNQEGLTGCFVPRISGDKSDKVLVTALASTAFPGAVTEIVPSEQNIRAAIDLDFFLQNIVPQVLTEDDTVMKLDSANPEPLRDSHTLRLSPALPLTPAFDPLQGSYALEVGNSAKTIKITPERAAGDTVTTVLVNGNLVQPEKGEVIPLRLGQNNILVTLLLPAEEWAAGAIPLKKEYLIKVNRANMRDLPVLTLKESNQPLDEGGVFRARYALELPAHYGVIPLSGLSGGSWPWVWTGTWTGTVNYGDGTGEQPIKLNADGSFDLEHRYPDDGQYKVNITFWYEDSGQVTGSLEVTVKNVAPTLTGEGLKDEITIKEGEQLTITGNIVDPGADHWTVTGDYGSVLGPKPAVLQDKTFTFQETFSDTKTTYAPNSTDHFYETHPERNLILKVSDDEGGVWQKTIKVKVENIAPKIEVGEWAIIQKGANFTRQGSFSDPGMDNWQGTVDYGDGGNLQPLELLPDKTFKLSHTYNTSGIYRVTVRITDHPDRKSKTVEEVTSEVPRIPDLSAGQMTPEQVLINSGADTAAVKLVHPLLSTGSVTPADTVWRVPSAGTPPELEPWGATSIASFELKVKDYVFSSDVRTDASVTEGEKFAGEIWINGPAFILKKYTIDYGDGSQEEKMVDSSDGRQILTIAKISHIYADDGTYPVTFCVEDVDGDVYQTDFQVEVKNAAPVVSIKSGSDYSTMETFTCYGSFSDPGSDTWTAAIDFGDGSGSKELKLNSDKTFSISHSYNSPGYYTITVTVSDEDGGRGQATQQVSVRSRGGGISSDASLHSLVLAGLTLNRLDGSGLTGFTPECLDYQVTGPAGVTLATVTAHPGATIKYTNGVHLNEDMPQNTPVVVDMLGVLRIDVKAQDGLTTRTYTLAP